MPAPRARWNDEPNDTPSGDALLAKSRANRWRYASIVLAIGVAFMFFCYWLQGIQVSQQQQTIQKLTAQVQMLRKAAQ